MAVARGQRLQVVFFESHKGQGKVDTWDGCAEVACRRASFGARRQQFFESLPNAEQTRLRKADDLDEQEQLFRASLPAADRQFLDADMGLGISQKAEVAWLDRRYKETGDAGYLYTELDMRDVRASLVGGTEGRGGGGVA